MVTSRGGGTLVLVTATCFLPATEGDRARLFALIRYFSRRGWRLVVIHMHDPEQSDADYPAMRAWCQAFHVFVPDDKELRARGAGGGPAPLDAWCPERLVDLVRRVSRDEDPDAVVAQFVYLSRCLGAVAGGRRRALRILDADNVFSQRGEAYRAAGVPHPWFETTAEEERRGLERADLVLAIQERELEELGRLAPGAPLLLVPHVEPPRPFEAPRGSDLLFVGARNPEAEQGIARFVAHAWPAIRRRHPEARLRIAGGVCHDLGGVMVAGVDRAGVVPSLDPLYRDAAIVLNTTAVGTGLKIKTVEALCWGRALVSTPTGLQGLERYPEIAISVATPEQFAAPVIDLLADRTCLEAIARRAWRFGSRYFAEDAVLGRLEAAIVSRASGPLSPLRRGEGQGGTG